MLRQRLEDIPSGLEALFALIFSKVDKEHREYLTKVFFLMGWSKENGEELVSDVSLTLFTAFWSPSPHQSLNDFVKDFLVTRHRVIAQGKGLFESYVTQTSMLDVHDGSDFGLCILGDPLSGNIGFRSIKHDPGLDAAETYETTCIGWVHRSAYDYILGKNSEYTQSWRNSVDEEKLLRRLLDAMSWLARYFPGNHMLSSYGPTAQVVNVFKDRTDEIAVAGFQALDKLRETIEAAYCEEGLIGFEKFPWSVLSSTRLTTRPNLSELSECP